MISHSYSHLPCLALMLTVLYSSAFDREDVAAVNCSHEADTGSRNVAYQRSNLLRAVSHFSPLNLADMHLQGLC